MLRSISGISGAVLILVAAGRSAPGQTTGLPPEWEVRQSLAALAQQVRRVKPIVEEIKPDEWTAKGASDTYKSQWKSVRDELDYLIRSADELSAKPERMTLALDALFRLQALKSLLDSLGSGVRQYQNPALADLLQGAVTENSVHGERLRQYVVQLAAAKEHELKTMNDEAQRCRSMLSRQPPPKAAPPARTEPK